MNDRLSARIQHQFDETSSLDLDLSVPLEGVTGVFGPSGSGKTSLLRALSGLLKADHAEVRYGDDLWQSEDTFMPAHLRRCGYVFQDANLFPHLTVADNIKYAQKRAKQSRTDVNNVVELLEIKTILNRRIDRLSGGEQQRVALARALVAAPRLLLLDEPLSGLDARLKGEILPFLARLKHEMAIPMVYVSHSADEIALLADHLLVVESGKVIANGPIQSAYPAMGDLAEVHLAILLEAMIVSEESEWHLANCRFPGGELLIKSADAKAPGQETRIRIQARDVSISLAGHEPSSILNRLPATVTTISDTDDPAMLVVTATVKNETGQSNFLAQITRKSAAELKIKVGGAVYLQIKSAAILG